MLYSLAKPTVVSPLATTNAAGQPISFTDFDSLLDVPIKSNAGTASKIAKGTTIGAAQVGLLL